MRLTQLTRYITALGAISLVLAFSACKDHPESSPDDCQSSYVGYTSPAAGTLTLDGEFYPNESILIRDASTDQLVASGTPASSRSQFTLTGVPSGTHEYKVDVSCQAGNSTIATENFTIL